MYALGEKETTYVPTTVSVTDVPSPQREGREGATGRVIIQERKSFVSGGPTVFLPKNSPQTFAEVCAFFCKPTTKRESLLADRAGGFFASGRCRMSPAELALFLRGLYLFEIQYLSRPPVGRSLLVSKQCTFQALSLARFTYLAKWPRCQLLGPAPLLSPPSKAFPFPFFT